MLNLLHSPYLMIFLSYLFIAVEIFFILRLVSRKLLNTDIIYSVHNSISKNIILRILFMLLIVTPAIALELWKYNINIETYTVLKSFNVSNLESPNIYFYQLCILSSFYIFSGFLWICSDLLKGISYLDITVDGVILDGNLVKWINIHDFDLDEDTLILNYEKQLFNISWTSSIAIEISSHDKYFIETLLYNNIHGDTLYSNIC